MEMEITFKYKILKTIVYIKMDANFCCQNTPADSLAYSSITHQYSHITCQSAKSEDTLVPIIPVSLVQPLRLHLSESTVAPVRPDSTPQWLDEALMMVGDAEVALDTRVLVEGHVRKQHFGTL